MSQLSRNRNVPTWGLDDHFGTNNSTNN